MRFSLVVPVFNEEQTMPHTHERLLAVLGAAEMSRLGDIEIIYVNDGSRDGTSEILHGFARSSTPGVQVRVLEFSRNFGHSAAVLAGVEQSKGELIGIIDADLQDPPELLPKMIAEITQQKYDVVFGQRERRLNESFTKRFTAFLFYRILSGMTGVSIPKDTGDFRVMTREVAEAVLSCREQEPFLRGLVAWVGFRQKAFPYVREGRKYGETKYPFRKMVRFASLALLSFSSMPLRLAFYLGGLGLLASFGIGIWALVVWLNDFAIPGWTSLLIGFLIGQSLTLLMVGVVSVYVGRVYSESQARPRYILRRRS